jgi:hypothetical protein
MKGPRSPKVLSNTQLVHAVALAHTIDGVTLELDTSNGDTIVVAHQRIDAHLNACQLRALVVNDIESDRRRLVESMVTVRITSGLQDIGASLYRRCRTGEERWFSTSLTNDEVCAIASQCPLDFPDDVIVVTARPDPCLCVTVVGIAANHPAWASDLDAVAMWLLGTAMVHELINFVRKPAPTPVRRTIAGSGPAGDV